VQIIIFWATGAAFFLVQLAMLLFLLRLRHRAPAGSEEHGRLHAEVVWTLVPASLIAVLALMLGRLIDSPWGGTR
jgi:heme/copper-type cytochrome/quinol oxidase subunit 2